MSDPSDCAFSIAAMVKDWYASPHKSDIPATLIDRRMARFQPSPALDALAMRERAADAYCKGDWDWFSDADNAIRALPTTFTDAELLAAAMQLPEVRALVRAADDLNEAISATNQFGDRSLTITGPTANLKWLINASDDTLTALAPFMKGGE